MAKAEAKVKTKPWRVAKGLLKLREQVNTLVPDRSKLSDGSIGDAAHATRGSDHNPWFESPKGMGVVTAVDVTHDPGNGLSCDLLANDLINDKRTKYVIWTGRIWKARTGKWETYRGPNAHRHHLHVSIKPEAADSETLWDLRAITLIRPTLKRGHIGVMVSKAQTLLNTKGFTLTADGRFGMLSEIAVRQFQKQNGLTENGTIDEPVWKFLES